MEKINFINGQSPYISAQNLNNMQNNAEEAINNLQEALINQYPIGSVYMTSTNTNPSDFLGGTWELIDKEFKKETGENIGFNFNNTNTSEGKFFYTKAGHSINIEFNYKAKVAVGDTILNVGTIDLEALGISRLANRIWNVGFSDGGNSAIMFDVSTIGKVDTVDVVGEASISVNSTCTFFACETISFDYMLDSACDKFYWKRTA